MNWRRIAVGTLVLGLVVNAMDYVLNTMICVVIVEYAVLGAVAGMLDRSAPAAS